MGNRTSRVTLTLIFCGNTRVVAARNSATVPTTAWAPKPTKRPGDTPPPKPWVKLPDLKATHKGDANWRELLVYDGRLTAEYFSAAPGSTVGRRFHPDTREWFAVVEGDVRVEIEGQPRPSSATNGSRASTKR